MVLIKYYNLESQSGEDVSGLERNLQKHLLGEKQVRGLLETDVEDVTKEKSGKGEGNSLAKLLYDSGDFDVLYKVSWTIANGKKRWFRQNVAPKVGTEMVIRATPEDILELQDYLRGSGFEVVESRAVSKATLSFGTCPSNPAQSKSYEDTIKRMIQEEYCGLRLDVSSHENVMWENRSGGTISGIVYGDVVKVLQFRNVLKNSASSYGTIVFRESVTFSQ
ncbi:MAG: hypothetical protein AABY40_01895 [Nanoarchaeota archaeon]